MARELRRGLWLALYGALLCVQLAGAVRFSMLLAGTPMVATAVLLMVSRRGGPFDSARRLLRLLGACLVGLLLHLAVLGCSGWHLAIGERVYPAGGSSLPLTATAVVYLLALGCYVALREAPRHPRRVRAAAIFACVLALAHAPSALLHARWAPTARQWLDNLPVEARVEGLAEVQEGGSSHATSLPEGVVLHRVCEHSAYCQLVLSRSSEVGPRFRDPMERDSAGGRREWPYANGRSPLLVQRSREANLWLLSPPVRDFDGDPFGGAPYAFDAVTLRPRELIAADLGPLVGPPRAAWALASLALPGALLAFFLARRRVVLPPREGLLQVLHLGNGKVELAPSLEASPFALDTLRKYTAALPAGAVLLELEPESDAREPYRTPLSRRVRGALPGTLAGYDAERALAPWVPRLAAALVAWSLLTVLVAR